MIDLRKGTHFSANAHYTCPSCCDLMAVTILASAANFVFNLQTLRCTFSKVLTDYGCWGKYCAYGHVGVGARILSGTLLPSF